MPGNRAASSTSSARSDVAATTDRISDTCSCAAVIKID